MTQLRDVAASLATALAAFAHERQGATAEPARAWEQPPAEQRPQVERIEVRE